MVEFIKKYFKKYKFLIIAVVCAAAVLTGAFFAGGKLGENAVSPVRTSSADSEIVSKVVTQDETEPAKSVQSSTQATDNSKSEKTAFSQPASTQSKPEQSATSKADSSSVSKASSAVSNSSQTSGSGSKDKYQTDRIPEGKPKPVEPQEQEIKDNTLRCTISISCATVLDNMDMLDPAKKDIIPSDGWILKPTTVTFNEGESVFDVLQRVCKENKIHLESSFTPLYNSAYIEGINNLYEFDCESLSGWMYEVDGWFPNYGCSRYEVKNGNVIEWQYTCNLGADIGGDYSTGG